MKDTGLIFTCFLAMFIISCDSDDSDEPSYLGEFPLVINVYDYNNDLVAHYIYDENDLLIKREFTDPITNV